jgi:hypothetical protein
MDYRDQIEESLDKSGGLSLMSQAQKTAPSSHQRNNLRMSLTSNHLKEANISANQHGGVKSRTLYTNKN